MKFTMNYQRELENAAFLYYKNGEMVESLLAVNLTGLWLVIDGCCFES